MKLLSALICVFGILNSNAQSSFPLTGYTAGQTWTSNGYAYSTTQNGTTMTAKVTQSASAGWFNLTGANSPNYATYSPGSCGSISGLYLATNRTSVTPVVSLELSFSPAVCGPLTFTIADLNGANASFRDDVTISAYDQNNVAIALTTAMVNNNGSGSCNGGAYGANYTHTSGNSLKVVGCSYDDCSLDYFSIYSSTKMISRITIDYASGNKDWNGTTISDPALQYIIVNNIRAWTPVINITPDCFTDPVALNGSIVSPFPPNTSPWGIPNASYPSVASGSQPSAPTYSWTGTAGTINSPSSLSTTVSGLTSSGGTFTLTRQNNRGCVATKSVTINSASCDVLPVGLTFFDGSCSDDKRTLKWTTESESNNDYFSIEQSIDGEHFSQIGIVNGAGNSTSTLDYEFVIPESKGDYFRLRQVDFDGVNAITDVINVLCNVSDEEIIAFPNPFKDELTINLNGLANDEITIILSDLNGKIVYFEKLERVKNSIQLKFEIMNLSGGIYFVEIRNSENNLLMQKSKVVKLT